VKEERVTQGDHDPTTDVTSVFASGLISSTEPDAVEEQLTKVDGLAPGTALLVVKRGPNAGSRFILGSDQVSAGRHPDSDIFLDDVSVSRRHAEFRRAGDGYEVVDVGSLNGTYVNREAIESATLAGGDEIQIGKFRLVFLTGSPNAAPQA
jgi:pSer/pThr/pTyr-binding forkhead associated (FHA) protein